MSWFKVDDKLHSHKKAARAGVAAMGLWVLAGSWCSDQETDGFIPDYMVRRIDPDGFDLGSLLVRANLWERAENDGDEGFQFRDWAEYQPTRADKEAEREAARERMRTVRKARKIKEVQPGSREQQVERSTEQETMFAVSSGNPDPTRPVPIKNTPPNGGFAAFWSAYPRKVGRVAAEKAYAKAVKLATHDEIMRGVNAYAATVRGQDQQYTAHPSTWLNAGRWADEYAPSPALAQYRPPAEADADGVPILVPHANGWGRS